MRRFAAFWSKDVDDYPPIRVRFPAHGIAEQSPPVVTEAFVDPYDYWDGFWRSRADFPDDAIPALQLDMGAAFMSSVMGNKLWYDQGTTWSEHALTDWSMLDELERRTIGRENPAISRVLAAARSLREKSGEASPISVAMLTGPGDVMTALRGPSDLCVDLFEHPNEVRRLATVCTEAIRKTMMLQFETIAPFRGGYVDSYDIWTPGRSSYFANDFSILVSPELYREFFFPFDARTAEVFETPWLHVHSGGARLVPEFREIPGLRGIQIVNDRPAGPSARDLIPVFTSIQDTHCLLLRKYSPAELETILPELSREGLYVDTQVDSEDEAWRVFDWWRGLWK